jgi:hypothetical protein
LVYHTDKNLFANDLVSLEELRNISQIRIKIISVTWIAPSSTILSLMVFNNTNKLKVRITIRMHLHLLAMSPKLPASFLPISMGSERLAANGNFEVLSKTSTHSILLLGFILSFCFYTIKVSKASESRNLAENPY